MDESLDDLSASLLNTTVFNVHGSNDWSKSYKTKQNTKYISSLHKQTQNTFLYIHTDKEDIMGDPITKSFRKSTFTWWDCKLFDKK